MIVKFGFSYDAKFNEWQRELLLKHWPDTQFKADKPDELERYWDEFTCHISLAFAFCMKLRDMEQVKPVRYPGEPEDAALSIIREPSSLAPVNHLCNVVVPGNALLNVRTVQNQDNCCTDHLELMLKRGWMILAVCPQPDQRRPDYILGHNDPKVLDL